MCLGEWDWVLWKYGLVMDISLKHINITYVRDNNSYLADDYLRWIA